MMRARNNQKNNTKSEVYIEDFLLKKSDIQNYWLAADEKS